MPVQWLRDDGQEVAGYFFNPNIQPFREYDRRLSTLTGWAAASGLPVTAESYDPVPWLRRIAFREEERCSLCYEIRLSQSAAQAKRMGFDGFSSTLLYSIYQNRESIIAAGCQAAQKWEIEFLDYDFRPLWVLGQAKARELELYRQPYCGCIFSEAERYMKKKPPLSINKGGL
jgi:predicted adenine nucleotide alpha hydrolase (AANH) superfamily ATPase